MKTIRKALLAQGSGCLGPEVALLACLQAKRNSVRSTKAAEQGVVLLQWCQRTLAGKLLCHSSDRISEGDGLG